MKCMEVTRMNKIPTSVMLIVLLIGLMISGCIGGGPDTTIADELEERPSLSSLVDALSSAGLYDMFGEEGDYTLLAPTNEALASLDERYVSNPALLEQILTYHVLDGSYSAAKISQSETLTTLQGETIEVDSAGTLSIGGASVTEQDIECTNGTLQVIDTVLVPPSIEETYIDYTFTDGAGREVTIEKVPERVVSLASSATEVMFAIDAGDKVVGVDKYSTYPEEVTELPNLGSGSSLDMEKLIELEPDLVVIWYFYGEAIENIEQRGINVMAINPASVSDIYDEIGQLGTILGVEESAQDVIDDLQTRISGITDYVDTIPVEDRPMVYYETSQPFKSLNADTFTGELISMAGGVNIAADQESRYPVLSSEWVIQEDPDVIVVLSYGASVEEIKAREGWDQISAVANDRVYSIESDWVTSNPRLVLGLEQLAKWFYPDYFE
jgi:iron complex transport system substrate-binding protein